MSLHVNLILDSERRSGSNVSKKFIIQIVAVVVPTIIVLVFLALFFVSKQARSRVDSLQESWASMESARKVVQNIQQNLTSCKAVAKDITAWRDSEINMSELLMAVSEAVPETIQLTRMTLSDDIGSVAGAVGRTGSIFLRGRVTGERPNEKVSALEKTLMELDDIKSATVMRYEAEAGDLSKIDEKNSRVYKVFDVECLLRTRVVR